MNKLTMNWMKKFKDHPQCKEKMNYFPKGYRLYVRGECKKFFKILNSQEYDDHKKKSPIQFIMKVVLKIALIQRDKKGNGTSTSLECPKRYYYLSTSKCFNVSIWFEEND